MGQVIRLSLPPTPYPELSAKLDTAEAVVLIAVRWWVRAFRLNEDPLPRLRQGLLAAGVRDAALSVDTFMSVVRQSARRPIAVHSPRCPHLVGDEKCLLHAMALAQAGDSDLAERVLRTALLSAQGAEFALGPLDGLGRLLAGARLLLRRRLPPDQGASGVSTVESWSPSLFSDTVH